jgi:hypothetical protein
MTSAAVAAATTPLPRPRAISAPVEIEVWNRILVVKRPQDCSGYEAYLWRQAHEALANRGKRGWNTNLPAWMMNPVRNVWCSAPGHPDLVRATPGGNLELHFRFGDTSHGAVYTELVSKPGLYAIVTADIGTRLFLGVKFLHRP